MAYGDDKHGCTRVRVDTEFDSRLDGNSTYRNTHGAAAYRREWGLALEKTLLYFIERKTLAWVLQTLRNDLGIFDIFKVFDECSTNVVILLATRRTRQVFIAMGNLVGNLQSGHRLLHVQYLRSVLLRPLDSAVWRIGPANSIESGFGECSGAARQIYRAFTFGETFFHRLCGYARRSFELHLCRRAQRGNNDLEAGWAADLDDHVWPAG